MKKTLFALFLIFALVLTACGGGAAPAEEAPVEEASKMGNPASSYSLDDDFERPESQVPQSAYGVPLSEESLSGEEMPEILSPQGEECNLEVGKPYFVASDGTQMRLNFELENGVKAWTLELMDPSGEIESHIFGEHAMVSFERIEVYEDKTMGIDLFGIGELNLQNMRITLAYCPIPVPESENRFDNA